MWRCSGLMRSASKRLGIAQHPLECGRGRPGRRRGVPPWSAGTRRRGRRRPRGEAVSEERTPGRVMTACMVSSRRQTQSCTSWRGRLQSSANVATLLGTSRRVFDSGHGSGQGVLAEGPPGQVAGGGAELHAEQHGAEREGELAQEAAEPARDVVELAQVHGRWHRGGALLLCLDHQLQRRAVGGERAVGPLSGADGVEGDARPAGWSARCRWRWSRGARPPGPAPRTRCAPADRRCRRPAPSVATPWARVRAASNQVSPPPGADPMTFKRSPRSPPIGLSGSPAPNMLTSTC